MTDKLWWYVARSSGIVAWALAAASVIYGLLLSTRLLGRRPGGPWLLDLHRWLGGLTATFLAVHLVSLWADSFTYWAWGELFVPFVTTWRPGAVAWGIVALYAFVAVQATSLVMRRLPLRLWRAVHFGSAVVLGAGTVHFLQAGTDRANPVLRALVVAVVVAVGALTVVRVVTAVRDRRRRRQRPVVRRPAHLEVVP